MRDRVIWFLAENAVERSLVSGRCAGWRRAHVSVPDNWRKYVGYFSFGATFFAKIHKKTGFVIVVFATSGAIY